MLTPAVHYHTCPTDHADWPHAGYTCTLAAEALCPDHDSQPPGAAKEASKRAVAEMAQKMRDLYKPV